MPWALWEVGAGFVETAEGKVRLAHLRLVQPPPSPRPLPRSLTAGSLRPAPGLPLSLFLAPPGRLVFFFHTGQVRMLSLW